MLNCRSKLTPVKSLRTAVRMKLTDGYEYEYQDGKSGWLVDHFASIVGVNVMSQLERSIRIICRY